MTQIRLKIWHHYMVNGKRRTLIDTPEEAQERRSEEAAIVVERLILA